MTIISRATLAACVLLPAAAFAQARNGNVFDGTAHQPTAAVQSEEKSAGVAPSEQSEQRSNRDLSAINGELLRKAQQDAKAVPSSTDNVFGVQPGGVVQTTPNAGTAR